MANTIEYADSPNVDTAFVVQEGGQKNRAVLTAPQDTTTLELPDNPNSTKGYVTIDGKKHKVILVADISGNGGGGGGAVDSVNGKTGVVVLNATDVGAIPQYETMPTADASNADLIVQFVGATDTYTNGYFYKSTENSGVYSWEQINLQPAPATSTAATATLVVADWSSNTQTVNVTGVTSSNNVIVAPAPASQADYTTAGILCTAQGSGTLTFTCTTVPSSAITVNVLII